MAILFIVDGEETELFRHLCPKGAEFRRHRNGIKYTVETLARDCAAEIEDNSGFQQYIVIADLEARARKFDMTAEAFEAALQAAILEALGGSDYHASRLIVASSDRMIENWLFAGITAENVDGRNGVHEMRTHFGAYSKVISGLKYLKSKEFSLRSALASPSFARFAHKMPQGLCPGLDNALGR